MSLVGSAAHGVAISIAGDIVAVEEDEGVDAAENARWNFENA